MQMARAKSLFHSAKHAINFMARSIACNAIRQQLKDQGVRVSLVPTCEIEEKARVYLANHPELHVQARERARKMGWVDEQLSGVLVTPDWYGKRSVS
jgi:hypothetical protein